MDTGSSSVPRSAATAIAVALGVTGCFGAKADDTWDPPTATRDGITRWRVTDDRSGELLGEGCASDRPMDFHANPGDTVTLVASYEKVVIPINRDVQHCNGACDCPSPYGHVEQDTAIPDPACWTPEHAEGGPCFESEYHAAEVISSQRTPANASGAQPCTFAGSGFQVNLLIHATGAACFGINGHGFKQWLTIYAR